MAKKISTGIYSKKRHHKRQGIIKRLFKLETDHERVSRYVFNNSRVLDYGCGDCSFFDYLRKKRKGLKLVGYDNDEKYVRIGDTKGYNVVTSLKIKGGFDFVVCNQVVEHMDLNTLTKFLEESHSLLKKNGILIISTLNGQELYNLKEIWNDPTHVRPYNLASLNRAGFQMGFNKIRGVKHHLRVNPWKLFLNLSLGFSPYSGIMIIFKKI